MNEREQRLTEGALELAREPGRELGAEALAGDFFGGDAAAGAACA